MANSEPADEPENAAWQYRDVAAVYDVLMADVPHRAWLMRIEAEARVRGKRPESALDVACGTGIVTEMLPGLGYAPVVGIDLAAPMVRIAQTKARAKNLPITYQQQDAATLDLHGQTFDLIVSLFDSLNYILEPEHLQQAFGRIYEHAAPGALFAFDLNSVYALAQDFFSQSGVNGPVRHVWRSYWNEATRLCRVEMEFWVQDDETGGERHFTETHLQRAYTLEEIQQMLQIAGFVQSAAYGNYGRRFPTAKSDRVLFAAEKPV